MRKLILSTLFILFLTMCKEPTKPQAEFVTDTYTTEMGGDVTFTFFGHATLGIDFQGCRLYVDPVCGFMGDVNSLPKADAILVTHHHYDHFEVAAVEALLSDDGVVICDVTTKGMIEHLNAEALSPGEGCYVGGIEIETIPAYNTSEGHTDFHPQSRGDVGYILNIGGTRIYIAGDGEPTPEMLSLSNIDIAFLPVNQPYTMTEEQASEVLHTLRPRIFYPYHYGQVDHQTDLAKLQKLISDIDGMEMRIRPME